MIYVALTALAVLAVVVLAFAGLLRGVNRQHAREREQLLARLMHLAGRTWEPPPSDQYRPPEPVPEFEFEPDPVPPGL